MRRERVDDGEHSHGVVQLAEPHTAEAQSHVGCVGSRRCRSGGGVGVQNHVYAASAERGVVDVDGHCGERHACGGNVGDVGADVQTHGRIGCADAVVAALEARVGYGGRAADERKQCDVGAESVGGNHGVAVLHDVEPCEFEAQRRPQTDAFKAYLHIFGVGKAFSHGTAQCFLSPWRIERQNAARYQEYGSEQDEKQYSDYFSDDVHNAVCVTNVFLLIENRLVSYLFSAGAFFSRSMSSKSLLQAFSSRSSTSSKPSAPS